MWSSGDGIAIRNVWFGRIRSAAPARVVADDGELLVTWIPPAVRYMGGEPRGVAGEWRLVPGTWRHARVLLHRAGEPWLASHIRDGAERWWYVDVVDSVRRTSVGLDHRDLFLDVETRDGVQVLDEDELADAERRNFLSAAEGRHARRTAAEVVSLVAAHEPPFGGEWESWEPDPAWPVPVLPEGWDVV